MGIENYSEDVLLVTLPSEPHMGCELDDVTETVSQGCYHEVIVDFSMVEMLTSESICALMILDKYVSASEHQLLLCNISPQIMHIFRQTALAATFTFSDDEHSALEAIHSEICMCQ